MVRFVIVALILAAPAIVSGQDRIKAARIPVEREAFITSDNRNYDAVGIFDALGSVTFVTELTPDAKRMARPPVT